MTVILISFIFALLPILSNAESIMNNPAAIEKLANSVVMLSIFDDNNNLVSSGSGFMVFDNRTIVTNYHVIKGASVVLAESDDGDRFFVNKILIASERWDIAILQLMAQTVIEPLPFSTNDLLRGSPVIVIGSPKGYKNTVSTGIVSSLYLENDIHWIQFTAPASPGSSGGPICNDNGQVIGMTTWNRTDAQNINFGIEISNIIDLYEKWDHVSSWTIQDHEKAVYEGHGFEKQEDTVANVTQMEYIVHFKDFDRKGLYTGSIINGLPNGFGLFITQNDQGRQWHYIGEWVNGKMEGQGSLFHEENHFEIKGIFENNFIDKGLSEYYWTREDVHVKWFDKEDKNNNKYFEMFYEEELLANGYADMKEHKVISASLHGKDMKSGGFADDETLESLSLIAFQYIDQY